MGDSKAGEKSPAFIFLFSLFSLLAEYGTNILVFIGAPVLTRSFRR
jgi:hypothetical protein